MPRWPDADIYFCRSCCAGCITDLLLHSLSHQKLYAAASSAVFFVLSCMHAAAHQMIRSGKQHVQVEGLGMVCEQRGLGMVLHQGLGDCL